MCRETLVLPARVIERVSSAERKLITTHATKKPPVLAKISPVGVANAISEFVGKAYSLAFI
jgi:hypothetical protein